MNSNPNLKRNNPNNLFDTIILLGYNVRIAVYTFITLVQAMIIAKGVHRGNARLG